MRRKHLVPDSTYVPDVQVGNWQMLWNAWPDAGRLAPGIPLSNFWSPDPNGLDLVGADSAAQGFEFTTWASSGVATCARIPHQRLDRRLEPLS